MEEDKVVNIKKEPNKISSVIANVVSFTLTGCVVAIAVALTIKLIMWII